MPYSLHSIPRLASRTAALALTSIALFAADQQPRIEYHRVASGFIPEIKNSYGWAKGTGFATENAWGQYTAYLMLTNAQGQRTWRLEHYLPWTPGPYVSIPDPDTSQGSTMYLLEGSSRALLIDTANPAKATEGVNDLKTVVRCLLGHENDGKPRAHPLDFVVAITHNHPDHIGENKRMSDRTIYYPDLDWPAQPPPNYVPIREGGGLTNHGNGIAVSQAMPQTLAADATYGNGELLHWLEQQNITPYMRTRDSSAQRDDRLYSIDRFTHDPETNNYFCPQGKQLTYVGINARNRSHVWVSSPKRCRDCQQKDQCTTGDRRWLAVHIHEAARQRARDLANTPAFARSQHQRRKVEALFAELKNQIGLRRLRLRRMKFVREQFFLAATAQNLKRLVRFLHTNAINAVATPA